DRFNAHAESHHRIDNRMLGEMIRKRLQRTSQANDLFSSHTTRNVQRENDCERSSFTLTLLDLEERDRLFGAVGIDLEVFLAKVANRAAFSVDSGHVH